MTGEKMMIPENPKTIYSINEGNYLTWDSPMQKCVDDFRMNKPAYTARYVGSMVADVHRTLMYGGIYMYPADAAKVRATLCLLLLFDVLLP
jgi:fructose-1,6-bisphosphatase I